MIATIEQTSTQRSASEVYHLYRQLWRANLDRSIRRLRIVAPELPESGTHHLAHNWYVCSREDTPTKRQVERILEEEYTLTSYLRARETREYNAAQHREHVASHQSGCYLWCDACMADARWHRGVVSNVYDHDFGKDAMPMYITTLDCRHDMYDHAREVGSVRNCWGCADAARHAARS